MKKTKTGLHIQTRKNRIEVYTQKELEQKLIKQAQARDIIIKVAIVFLSLLTFTFGVLIGCSI